MKSIRIRICKPPRDQRSAVSCWLIGRAEERGQGRFSDLGDGHLVTNTMVALTISLLSFYFHFSFLSSFFLFIPTHGLSATLLCCCSQVLKLGFPFISGSSDISCSFGILANAEYSVLLFRIPIMLYICYQRRAKFVIH
jgi:hypothetical protein